MWFRKESVSLNITGMKQATGVVAYVLIFSQIIMQGSKIFPNLDNTKLGPIMFLTVFSFSVLACVTIVFYQPYLLFTDKKPKEAARLVLETTKWMGIYVVAVIAVVAWMSR